MQKYGFIYIWFDRKHKRYYIGAHWGHENDGYICSSTWMNLGHKKRPKDFKRRILARITTSKKDMFEAEDKWLQLIKEEELGKRYYNLQRHWQHWTSLNNQKQIKEKISDGVKNHYKENGNHWQGKKHSEETKRKMSEAAKTRKSSPRKGMKWSDEAKLRNKGKSLSEKTKQKLSIALKNNKNGIGNKNHLGHKHSEKTKRLIGEKAKQRHINILFRYA